VRVQNGGKKLARPRTPTALKLVKGTAQACRTNKREPAAKSGIPKPPEHLSPRAQRAWPGIARMLNGMGVLTKADGLVLEALCETYGELVEARERLRERGALSYRTEQEAKLEELIEEALAREVAPAELGGVEVRLEPQPQGGALKRVTAAKLPKVMWRAYPEVAMIADLDRRFAMWLAKVGLTPADRSRVSAVGSDQKEADPWSRI